MSLSLINLFLLVTGMGSHVEFGLYQALCVSSFLRGLVCCSRMDTTARYWYLSVGVDLGRYGAHLMGMSL